MAEPAPPAPSATTAPTPGPTTTTTTGTTPAPTTNSTMPSITTAAPNSNPNSNSNLTTNANPPPPQGPDSSTSASSTTNRGLPYYEKLRRELRDTLQKKRLMDKSMAQLEDQIYRFEQSYLEETTAGNIIKGFDNYIKGSSSGAGIGGSGIALSGGVGGGGGGGAARRKATVTDADRVFSRSSAGFMRDSPAPSSAQTTPSHAATPNSTYNGSTGKPGNGDVSSAANSVKGQPSKNKKKSVGSNKDKGEDDGTDGDRPPTKRLKITYGRD